MVREATGMGSVRVATGVGEMNLELFFNPNPRARCGANYIYQSTPPTRPNKRLISIKAEI
jgi:hypothetical protein